jgi:hypothetical protein
MPLTYDELADVVALRLEKQSAFTLRADQAGRFARAILDDIEANNCLVIDDEAFDPDAANVG